MINPSELKDFVESNPKLVTRKESKNYPGVFVIKYKNNVFYDNSWSKSKFLVDCRGLVVDQDYNVVIRPFTKIFNYKENSAGLSWLDDEIVFVTRKVNGFMAGLTNVNGELIVSTTGSLDSDFVGYATEYLRRIKPSMCAKGYTYMFEICHPSDPHIIPELFGAYLLAIVTHSSGEVVYKFDSDTMMKDAIEDFEGLAYTDDEPQQSWLFGELKGHIKEVKHEGFVIVNSNGDSQETIKIKSPYYLTKKFFARIGEKKLIDGIRTGTIKQRLEEEYFPLIDYIKEMGADKFLQMEEQARLELLTAWIEALQY